MRTAAQTPPHHRSIETKRRQRREKLSSEERTTAETFETTTETLFFFFFFFSVIACECISHVLKPEDVCERKNKKKRAVERERFLTSQRTQISHHLEYFYNTTF
jgi:hypothetical protein